MEKYFADVHASHESQLQNLPHGLADTDEILACRAKPQTYENILELADALCWQLRFREAIDALTQAVKLEPERMEAYRKRGPSISIRCNLNGRSQIICTANRRTA